MLALQKIGSSEHKTGMNLTLLGIGAFGTALAHIAKNNKNTQKKIVLLGRSSAKVATWNKKYALPFYEAKLLASSAQTIRHSSAIIYALPAQIFRSFWTDHLQHIRPETPILVASKGIESTTGLMLPEIAQDIGLKNPLAVLGGPHLASELLQESPAIGLLGGPATTTLIFKEILENDRFLLDICDNTTLVSLASALKNAYAILGGILHGEQTAENTRSSFLAQGLQEVHRFIQCLSNRSEGRMPPLHPALIADYMLTVHSLKSRNTKAGILLGSKKTLPRNTLVEGLETLKGALIRAHSCGIYLPILEDLHARIEKNKPLTLKAMDA